MNIQSLKPEGHITPPGIKAPAKPARASASEDVFIPEQNAQLLKSLSMEPAVRPDMVERGRTLASDPSYPFGEVLTGVAERILSEVASFQ